MSATTERKAMDQTSHQPLEQLRTNDGKLDPQLVAEMFDLEVDELAGNLGIAEQALSQNQESADVQSRLQDFERIANNLLVVTGSIDGLKSWLHSPNERFDDHTPLEVLKLGKAKLLADWVDDARLGSPD